MTQAATTEIRALNALDLHSFRALQHAYEQSSLYEAYAKRFFDFHAAESLVTLVKGKPAAFLRGCYDTQASDRSFPLVASERAFRKHWPAYPAHFHIAVDSGYQRRGLGTKLVERFLADLRGKGIAGVHLITSKDQSNVAFYEKLGFQLVEQRRHGRWQLLFLGKRLAVP